jgi:basic membrane protein A and related proteins
MDRRNFLKYVTLAGSSLALTSCVQGKNSKSQVEVSPSASPVVVNEPLKVGFVYVGPVGDFGWT